MATTDTQQAAQFSAEAAVSAAEAKQYLIEAQQGYQDTSAAAQEAKDAAAAAATSEQNATYSEANAAQSAAAAVDAKADAEAAASSASDYAKNKFTFYKTASDPDGTIAGLAATTEGQSFWVAQGPDALSAAWQYQNVAGVAVLQAKQPGTAAITGTIREFPTLTAAQADADAGNIPVGSTAYYRSPDDSALAIEVINNGGTLVATGRKMPSQHSVDYVTERVKNQTLSVGFFKGKSVTSAAADIGGNCIFLTVESGDIYVATEDGMMSVAENAFSSQKALSFGFYKGNPVIQVNTDKAGVVLSLTTAVGSSVNDGTNLIDVIPDVATSSQQTTLSYGFVFDQPVVKMTTDIKTGQVLELVGKDGNIYSYVDSVLTKITNIAASDDDNAHSYIYSGAQRTYLGRDMSFYTPDPSIIYIFLDMGQSNSWGQYSGGVPTIAGVPVYPDNALMLNTGVRATLTEATSLVPLVETNEGIASETSGSSWVNHTIRDVEALTGVRPTILMLNASQGGMRYYQLTRGQTAYKQFQTALKSAVSLIMARGKKPVVAAVRWMQGEAETAFVPSNKSIVQAQLRQLQRFVADDASQITGTPQDPLLFVNQIAPVSKYTEGIWRQPVKEAQLLRDGKIIPVGPVFQYPMADGVHMNSWGRNYLGQCLAMATVTEVFGSSYAPQLPGEYAWLDDVTLRINLDAAFGTLTLDTSGTVSMTGLENYGFNFDDYSATPPVITAVTLNESSIDITLNKSPRRSWRLAYAMKPTGDNAGPVTGARGCLRDSAGHQNLYDTSVVTHNWYPSFIIHSR
ncbi:hypothetical protein GJJ22_08520 [Klebsiella pneumoniae]|nr:hypothetical protein [Klebsiella pneumoniae]